MNLQNKIAPPQPSQRSELDTDTHLATLRDQLLCYCEFLSGSHHEAEDLVQTTLLKALSVVKGEPHRNVPALLRRIAKNAWIDEVRKQSKYRLCDAEELTAISGHVAAKEPSELESAFQVLIHRLTRQQQAIFLLSEVFEYKDQEIAERLGISRGAVKAALHRAKARLDSMPPNYEELLSVENEAQKEILKAYLSAFHSADTQMLIHLCQGGVLDPVQATTKVLTFAKRQAETRKAVDYNPRLMLAAA